MEQLLKQSAVVVAPRLLGAFLFVKDSAGNKVGGRIIETEAYNQDDAASHSYKGKTPRTEVMFGPAGHIYVYFTYGMHWCMNIVAGPEGRGEAVLIRSLQPTKGLEVMRERRKKPESELTNGPAKVCQALAVNGADNGARIGDGRFELVLPKTTVTYEATPRIGITRDTHRLWRFVEKHPPAESLDTGGYNES